LSELRQISTSFDNFWQTDDKETNILRDVGYSNSTSTDSCHRPWLQMFNNEVMRDC